MNTFLRTRSNGLGSGLGSVEEDHYVLRVNGIQTNTHHGGDIWAAGTKLGRIEGKLNRYQVIGIQVLKDQLPIKRAKKWSGIPRFAGIRIFAFPQTGISISSI